MHTGQLFIEVGCEELPAGWSRMAAEHIATGVGRLLEGIPHGATRTWATPRRVAIAVDGVALARPLVERLVTGPAADKAYVDGVPTKATLGFARGRGVGPEALEIVDGPKGRVVAVRIREGGEPTAALLLGGLEAVILGVPFAKTMRWGRGPARWARPIHSVCVILGGEPVEMSVAAVPTRPWSTGLRRRPGEFPVRDAEGWLADLRDRAVIPDVAERREAIRAGLIRAAAEQGVVVEIHEALLEEVTDLLEWPVVVAGRLDPGLMALPPRLLVTSMRVHQRTFPTRDENGELAPVFLVAINNPDADPAVVAAGNARVLAARFQDARFFFQEDRKVPLDDFAAELHRMQWVRGLGSMADKSARLVALCDFLAPLLGADPAMSRRAAGLAKADLLSKMVGEFPELQGHVGRLYAAHRGEPDAVAWAIEEHYLPRFAGDALPRHREGRVVALADRLDTLAGCFAIGLAPRGSADPQGLRRAAIGVIAILRDAGVSVSLDLLLREALRLHPMKSPMGEVVAELSAFILARFRAQLQSEDVPTEVVDAVMDAGGDDVVRLAGRVAALRILAAGADFEPLRIAFRRVMGLSKDHASAEYIPENLVERAEMDLDVALRTVSAEVAARADALDYEGALRLMASLRPSVDTLFDQVMVMVDDPEVRRNRLGLLRAVADLFRTVADFTRLSGEGAGN